MGKGNSNSKFIFTLPKFILMFFFISSSMFAQKFVMVDPLETHNWHWFQWGSDGGSISYSTDWSSNGSSSLKLVTTDYGTDWNIFGTGCFDAETPDSIRMDIYALNNHRFEVKVVTSTGTEVLLGGKNLAANTQYLNWKVDFTAANMKKMFLTQCQYSGTVSVYVDNIRTYKNGVEKLWDNMETPHCYWDGSADADSKNNEYVLSDGITTEIHSENLNSTAALTMNWQELVDTTADYAQIAVNFPQPQDWTNYFYFNMDVYRPSSTADCDIFIFIWDGTKGAGTDWVRVPANQWTNVTLKIGESVDMSNITEVKIVVPSTDIIQSGKLYFDNLRIGGFIPESNPIDLSSIGVKYSLDDFDGRVPDQFQKDSVVRAGYNDLFGYTGGVQSSNATLNHSLSNIENGDPAHSKPFAWKIDYDVSYDQHSWVAYWNVLGPGAGPVLRDLSDMEKFSIWIKGDVTAGCSNRINLEFHDNQWGNPGYDSGKAFAVLSGVNSEWQQWIVPFNMDSLAVYGTFDPTKVKEVVISVENGSATDFTGKFYIDDLQFVDTDEIYWNDADFDEDFLNLVEQRTFNYFIESADETTGLVYDRSTFLDLATVAGTGFGLAAVVIGAERGWISQQDAEDYIIKVLTNLWTVPQGPGITGVNGYKGFFYHFLEANTGYRKQAPAGQAPVELSVVDTGILMAGVLLAQEYFSDNSTIVDLADKLYRRVDWQWYYDTTCNQFHLGWSPENGYAGHWDISTDEVALINILAVGSPTFPVPSNCFYAWLRDVGTYNNRMIINSWNGSLFQYFFAHCWFDLYGKKDAQGVDWWQNSIQAGLANRDYCIAGIDGSGRTNVPTYSANSWGLSACEQIPNGIDTLYFGENGALPTRWSDYDPTFTGVYHGENDGTVPPYGAGSMIGFAAHPGGFNSSYVLDALKNYYKNTQLWTGTFGFRDCYTDTAVVKENAHSKFPMYKNNFFSIDQGPMLMMIENFRSKLIWNYLMENDYIDFAINEIFVPDFRVNDDISNTTQLSPATHSNKSGKYVSVWSDRRNESQESIYAQRYYRNDDVGTFRVEGINLMVTTGDTAVMKPQVAINGNDKYLVSWHKYNAIFAKIFNFNDAADVASEIKINSTPIYSNEQSAAVTSSSEGSFAIVWTGINQGKDIYAQIIDSTGSKVGINFKVNSDATGYDQFEPDVSMDGNGNFVVVWADNRSGGLNTDIYLQKYDKTGSAIGANLKVNGATARSIKPAIDLNENGKFIVTWLDTSNCERNIFAQRFNSDLSVDGGILTVSGNIYGPAIAKPDVALDSTGAAIIVWQDSRKGSMDIYMQKYFSNGTANGYNTMAHSSREESSQINPSVTYLGKNTFQIIWQDDRNGDWDIYCPVGDPVPSYNYTDVQDESETNPVSFKLAQNYPNPFNPSTTIEYSIPERQKVKLVIYDILGQEVSTLVNEVKEKGFYKVNFNAASIPSGVYFYRINADSKIVTKKMMLLK